MSQLRHAFSLLLVVLVAAVAAGCGGDDGDPAEAQLEEAAGNDVAVVDPDELGHVHGLGVDPADGELRIASHYGLFHLTEGSVERVGERTLDLMGFAVVGPGHYVASGHPGPDEDGPPLLGLIETTDGGEHWQEVSLSGEADFHAMAVAGQRIYGFESYGGELMVSEDGGETWEQRPPPAPILSLAIDPDDTDRVFASTMDGLQVSGDAGASWSPVAGQAGLLTWPESDKLFHVDVTGQVRVSDDGGSSWQQGGTIGGMPAALFAEEAGDLYVARDGHTVLHSTDGGETWSELATPAA